MCNLKVFNGTELSLFACSFFLGGRFFAYGGSSFADNGFFLFRVYVFACHGKGHLSTSTDCKQRSSNCKKVSSFYVGRCCVWITMHLPLLLLFFLPDPPWCLTREEKRKDRGPSEQMANENSQENTSNYSTKEVLQNPFFSEGMVRQRTHEGDFNAQDKHGDLWIEGNGRTACPVECCSEGYPIQDGDLVPASNQFVSLQAVLTAKGCALLSPMSCKQSHIATYQHDILAQKTTSLHVPTQCENA